MTYIPRELVWEATTTTTKPRSRIRVAYKATHTLLISCENDAYNVAVSTTTAAKNTERNTCNV